MTATAETAARIQAAELQECLERGDGTRLVDVRSPAEFEMAHVAGAVNVPVDLLRRHVRDLGAAIPQDTVLVCQSGPRAEEARRLLAGAGRPEPRVLDGGMNAWESADAPVRRGARTWALERQVRMAAGSLVLAGILGSLAAPRARFLAGAVGGGLAFSAATDTCAMVSVLSRMPWNRGASAPSADAVLEALRD